METHHPLLRGGRRDGKKGYAHGFSLSELQSLTSICQTLLPSTHESLSNGDIDQSFMSSASQKTIPDEVEELLMKRGLPEAVFVVKLVLKLLSTRLGTLLLCGSLSFKKSFPYINKFSDISLENRERVLQRWSRETYFTTLRIIFVMLKIFCFFIYLSRTTEDSQNPAWDAMGYQLEKEHPIKPKKERPLQKGIVETSYESDTTLVNSLAEKGLKVTEDRKLNVFKIECDVVIVGSGCGGGVAAAVLAKSGQKVVVVEKGHYFVAEDYSSLEGPSLNQLYESGGFLSTLDGKCMMLAGSTVGGGSAVNCGLKNPNIGKNLHLHPVLMVWGYFPETLTDLPGKTFQGGIITSLHKISSHESESDIETVIEAPALGPASFSVLLPWVSRHDAKKRLLKYSRTAHLFALVKDQGSGEVKQEGRISYKLDPSDKENLKTGMRRALQILVAAGATEVGTHRSDGQRMKCKGVKEKKLEEFLDTVIPCGGPKSNGELWNIYCSAHQMGSCRMGATEEDGAVDENGESWEAEGLYVCDGSVLPSAIGVNPMITIQSTAYCLSNNIAGSLNK
ncbi:hypothetical protein GIB67_037623 [Kingdonia uniflora]|uniref:long-chain-alcohol oxidase n=1 Tax=Kingdonia uniflora TaxID=39325 RepID=A0A7J7LSU4_9MAGN|nr:hypothetical protein GIB67_037623 [Kingdonia uniflora]